MSFTLSSLPVEQLLPTCGLREGLVRDDGDAGRPAAAVVLKGEQAKRVVIDVSQVNRCIASFVP